MLCNLNYQFNEVGHIFVLYYSKFGVIDAATRSLGLNDLYSIGSDGSDVKMSNLCSFIGIIFLFNNFYSFTPKIMTVA